MLRVFLSFHFSQDDFRSPDARLANDVQDLLASHGVTFDTGQALRGEALTPSIQQNISDCDALVALMTRRHRLDNGGWTTHDWVRDEYGYAKSRHKQAISLVEDGVRISGALQADERIDYDPERPLPAFLRLSRTVQEWRDEIGRTVKIHLKPDDLVAEIEHQATWEYRLIENGAPQEWEPGVALPEAAGLFLTCPGIGDGTWIQVRATVGDVIYESVCAPQCITVSLRERQ